MGGWRTLLVVVFVSVCSCVPVQSYAASTLTITKVIANVPGPNTGHQWIQITNAGSEAIDVGAKNIRLVDHSGKHLIKSYEGSSTDVAPGASVIIAQNPVTFLSDTPRFSGTLLKSSFTLNETGTVSLVQTDGTVLASKPYDSVVITSKTSTKLSSTDHSSIKSKSTRRTARSKTYSSSSTYDSGTVAPTASADAAAVGAHGYALPMPPALVASIVALFSSAWFALFPGLLAFSGFSLMVIQQPSLMRPTFRNS